MKRDELIICKEMKLEAPVHFLHLDWMHGNVHIAAGVDEFVHVIQRANVRFPLSRCYETKISDNTLHIIDGCKNAFPLGINFQRTSLSILLPPRTMERISLKTVGTRITIDNITSQHLDCHCTSSKLNLSGHTKQFNLRAIGSRVEGVNLHSHQLMLQATSSPVHLRGQFTQIHSRTTGRSLTVQSSSMLHSLDHVSTSSHIDVQIPYNDEGFKLNFKQTGGRFKSDLALQNQGDQRIYGHGTYPFQVNVRGGSFRVGKYPAHLS